MSRAVIEHVSCSTCLQFQIIEICVCELLAHCATPADFTGLVKCSFEKESLLQKCKFAQTARTTADFSCFDQNTVVNETFEKYHTGKVYDVTSI